MSLAPHTTLKLPPLPSGRHNHGHAIVGGGVLTAFASDIDLWAEWNRVGDGAGDGAGAHDQAFYDRSTMSWPPPPPLS